MSQIKTTLYKRILEKKIRIDHYPPLHPDLKQQTHQKRTIEYIHSSNAIEGNTLTLGETAAAINGETINGKTITNYPTCPIEKHLQKPITEQTITELITQLENHEKELKQLRKQLQNQLLNYQINKITQK